MCYNMLTNRISEEKTMYIVICTMKKTKCGEPLVIKADRVFVGYVSQTQPDGCLDYETVCNAIGANRVFCKSAVAFDGLLIVSTDSPVFNTGRYVRREVEGYGLLLPV